MSTREESVQTSMPLKEIFQYIDYREFLKDRIENLKSIGKYGVRSFARKVGFGSPNYLQLVIDGRRNLGDKFLDPLSDALLLSLQEKEFFKCLVEFQNAASAAEKDRLFTNLMRFKGFREVRRLSVNQYHLFSDWRMVVLYEALGTRWANKTHSEMAKDLEVSEEELERRLLILNDLGLIERQDAHWIKTNKAIESDPQFSDIRIRNFHRQMIQKSLEVVDKLPPSERSLGALTMPLTEKTFRHLEKKLRELRDEITALHANEENPDGVYQLNIQLFPLLMADQNNTPKS